MRAIFGIRPWRSRGAAGRPTPGAPLRARPGSGASRIGALPIRLLGLVAVFLLPWAVYAPALFFPLFYDDLLHLALIEGRSLPALLRPLPEYGYYRPLVLLVPALLRGVMGRYEALAFHFLSLAFHLLNIALLVRLLRAVPRLRPLAVAAGWMFAAYPIHPQGILVPAFSLHVWQATFFLLAAGIYLRCRRPFFRHLALAALFLLALLNHETGILFGPMLALWAGLAGRRRWDWIPYLLAGGIYAGLYRWLPHGSPPAPGFDLPGLLERGRFAFQALAFPLVPGFFALLPERGDGALGLAALWMALALARWWGWEGLVGLAMFGLAAAPAGLLLPTGYFLHGPRLLYLASLGGALVWARWLTPAVHARRPFRFLQRLALIGTVAAAGLLAHRQVQLHVRALEPLRRLVRAAGDPGLRTALLVNFPEWVAERRRLFPVGSEGALIFGGHLLPGMLFIANTPARPQTAMVSIAVPFHRPEGYAFQPAGSPIAPPALSREIARADLVAFTVYAPAGPTTWVLRAADRHDLPPIGIAFGGGLQLVRGGARVCPGSLSVVLEWARSGAVAPDLSAALHVLDPAGRLIAQGDGPPWAGAVPFDQLPDGELLPEIRILPLRPGSIPAAVRLGVYDWKTGAPVPPRPASSSPFIEIPRLPCRGAP